MFLSSTRGTRHPCIRGLAAIACMAFVIGGSVSAEEDPKTEKPKPAMGDSDLGDREVTIVVADEPYTGYLVPPATDTGFSFKLADTGDKMTFRWSTLAATERKRIQKLFGIEVEDGLLKWGDEIKCTRFKLKSKKYIEGLEVPEMALPGHRCLRTATQIMHILRIEVIAEEVIVKRESDVFSAEEKYEELILERPPSPDSATDHLDYARKCSNMGLYDKAIDHLEMAKVIDPRTEERTKDFRVELVRKHSEKLAEKLYLQILVDLNAGDHASALDKILRLKRNFPNSEYYTRVDGIQAEVEKGAETDFVKKVIFMYYTTFNNMVDKALSKQIKVDQKGRPVPSRPGKQVTTLNGRIFRGELVSDGEDKVVLKQGDVTLEIDGKEILAKQDIELSKSFRTIGPNFGELKAYVTNPDGIGKDILKYIATYLKADMNRVRDAWEGRFVSTATYKNGEYIKTPTYATLHRAFYGKGSWLRDGVTQAQNPQGSGGGRRGSRNQGRRGQGQQREVVNPEISDDPEVWWKIQKHETKYQVLRALGSEKIFRVKQVSGKLCSECGGEGFKKVFDAFGSMSFVRCPKCRGLKMLFQIYYE